MRVNEILDFILPRVCSCCNKNLGPDELIVCPDCFGLMKLADTEFINRNFERDFRNSAIDKFATYFLFTSTSPIQKLIHSIKYSSRFGNAVFLGRFVAEVLNEQLNNFSPDLIHPIPLHPIKKAERGYNQSFYIAKGIGKSLGVKYKDGIIRRNKYTSTQTKLNRDERDLNMQGAFIIKKKKLNYKNVILVDDVVTTGATMRACAAQLKKCGVERIMAVSVAITAEKRV